jgi:anthranilate synthase component 2
MFKNKKLLIIDNYDSFTYNLVQLVEQCGFTDYDIKKNNEINLEEANNYQMFLFSPGPGIPSEAGIMCELIKKYAGTKKMLGICLGHQAIAECFGANLITMEEIAHGAASVIYLTDDKDYLFKKVPEIFIAGRYHSWIVSNDDFPKELLITAIDEDENIMAIKHKTFDIHGVQFHPESYITENGQKIISNFLLK